MGDEFILATDASNKGKFEVQLGCQCMIAYHPMQMSTIIAQHTVSCGGVCDTIQASYAREKVCIAY